MKKQQFIIRVVMLALAILGIAVRLYHIDFPIADWHSWRQVDTAAVARNFLKFGFDPLHPRYDDLSNIQTGKDNPLGLRMVEFPVYQLVAARFKQAIGIWSIEVWLRLVSIVSFVVAATLLGLLVSHYSDFLTGVLTQATFLFLPYSIYFGRTILPDVPAMSLAIVSIYAVAKIFTDTEKKSQSLLFFWLLLGTVSASLALLVKPMAVFLLLPAGYLFWAGHKQSKYWSAGLLVYLGFGLLPVLVWREWIKQFPEGIPAFAWLFNEGDIRFKGAWFYWLFAERLGKLLLGYWGLLPLGIGLLVNPSKKEGWLYRWFIIGLLAFWVIIARGNVQHDYYQVFAIPVLSIYLARGLAYLFTNKIFSRVGSRTLVVVSCMLMFAFSWYTVRTYFWINRSEIVEAGKAADELLPKDAKVIAPYNGDTTFLYQTNRAGWPLGFDIDKKIQMGATHYVTVSPTDADGETKDLASRFQVLIRNDRFAIIDLTQPIKQELK